MPLLAHCPFCNSTNVGLSEHSAPCVVCEDCGCEGPWTHAGQIAAFDLWNRRPAQFDLARDEILPTDHGDEG